ncbi:hypothetical protein U1Q18_025742 [Sarracenia purpurea var. burkii]
MPMSGIPRTVFGSTLVIWLFGLLLVLIGTKEGGFCDSLVVIADIHEIGTNAGHIGTNAFMATCLHGQWLGIGFMEIWRLRLKQLVFS